MEEEDLSLAFIKPQPSGLQSGRGVTGQHFLFIIITARMGKKWGVFFLSVQTESSRGMHMQMKGADLESFRDLTNLQAGLDTYVVADYYLSSVEISHPLHFFPK